jgi:hypothetical protein
MKFVIIALLAAGSLAAQEFRLPPSLDRLKDKATQVVDITLDSSLLQLASRFLSEKDADQAKVRKLVTGLTGIFVRSFEFDRPGEYLESDIESIRSQLKSPGWSRIVGVINKRDGENAEVYIKTANGQIAGLTIIAAEPKELTIVHIDGKIDPDQITDLSGQFGIPKLSKAPGKDSKKKDDE